MIFHAITKAELVIFVKLTLTVTINSDTNVLTGSKIISQKEKDAIFQRIAVRISLMLIPKFTALFVMESLDQNVILMLKKANATLITNVLTG